MRVVVGLTRGSQVLSGRAARHAMDGFDRRGYRLGIRLRPAQVGGEPLKKLFGLLAFGWALGGPVVLRIGRWTRRIRMVSAHGNLIADIVGEFGR